MRGAGGSLRTAHIDGKQAAVALTVGLRIIMWTLVGLSVAGTFYGIGGNDAPLFRPDQMLADLLGNPRGLLLALGVQAGLTIGQWGGAELAREDPRWWILYAMALFLSASLNLGAYLPALTNAGVGWLWAALLIIAGDIAPEWLLKK